MAALLRVGDRVALVATDPPGRPHHRDGADALVLALPAVRREPRHITDRENAVTTRSAGRLVVIGGPRISSRVSPERR